MIELTQDFQDLLVELSLVAAEYVVVGGYAVAFHGHPRATKDIDIYVRPEAKNGQKVFEALVAFGAPLAAHKVSPADFAAPGQVFQMGLPPRRIDLITEVDGIDFDEAIAAGCSFEIEGKTVPVIGLAALIKNKRASGRPQDLADVAALENLDGS